jgi:hypothetical protein
VPGATGHSRGYSDGNSAVLFDQNGTGNPVHGAWPATGPHLLYCNMQYKA